MDLLGGYDSNSDSDDGPAEPVAPPPSQPPTVPKNSIPSTKSTTNADDKKKKANLKRGKKLLKLSSVLPEHIWNQLSKGGGPQEDSDDDDDDDDKEGKKKKEEKERRQSQKKRLPGDKSDLTTLLELLPKSKTGNSLLGKSSSILGEDSSSTIIKGSSQKNASDTAKDGLGSAFLSSTVEVVRTKKSTGGVVRDIHKPVVETVDDEDEENDDDEDDDNNNVYQEAKKSKVSPQVATSFSSVPRPRVTPAPSYQSRTAAPPVASRYPPPPPPSYPVHAAGSASIPSYTQQQQQPQRSNKKSRKRQMEQMLRQGNLDGVTSDVHLEGQDNVYQMPQDQQTSSYQSHGVRVVPTVQYNVGSGSSAASMGISGKQRGKNQMNSLLASAASLESQRARVPQKQSTHRANARTKYGW